MKKIGKTFLKKS